MTHSTNSPKFPLGQVVATSAVTEWMGRDLEYRVFIMRCLQRHHRGDWGEVCVEDQQTNDDALTLGNRIVSKYHHGEHEFYIITEHDRSYTTIMFVEDY